MKIKFLSIWQTFFMQFNKLYKKLSYTYLSAPNWSLLRCIKSSWRNRFWWQVSIVQCSCRFSFDSTFSPHTCSWWRRGRGVILLVVIVGGPLSCTSQMFDFIRDLSICLALSGDAVELEDTWRKQKWPYVKIKNWRYLHDSFSSLVSHKMSTSDFHSLAYKTGQFLGSFVNQWQTRSCDTIPRKLSTQFMHELNWQLSSHPTL